MAPPAATATARRPALRPSLRPALRPAGPRPEAPEPPTRSERKHADILAAAAEAFREEGIHAASMDRIAARADVSKRTLYKHFGSKDALFDVVVAGAWARLAPPGSERAHAGLPLGERLVAVVLERLDALLDPELLGLFRAVLAESIRSPELGRAYRDARGHLGVLGLRALLEEEAQQGRLTLDEPELAAAHLFGLTLDAFLWPALLGLTAPPPRARRERGVRAGVAVFLAHYAPAPSRRPPSRRPSPRRQEPRR
jgi:TetR/AcrR family transcriptional regulator of autoinduction and epiphytic fitness